MPAEIIDYLIIGAGSAGLYCSIQVDNRYLCVLVLDDVSKSGKKILMSGGGHCNLRNLEIGTENYLRNNPHLSKFLLPQHSRVPQNRCIALVTSCCLIVRGLRYLMVFQKSPHLSQFQDDFEGRKG